MQEDDKQRQKEREREALIRQYTLPDNPTILVHPSPTAKSGKFECTVMSLSLLLDYRPEDNKEHVFEVRNNNILDFWQVFILLRDNYSPDKIKLLILAYLKYFQELCKNS